VQTRVAPSHGELRNEDSRKMDAMLKILVAALVSNLKRTRLAYSKPLSWDQLLEILKQAPFAESYGNDVSKRDSLNRKGTAWFKFNGSPDAAVVKEVHAWFASLVQDDEVLRSTKIDLNMMAKIVAKTGAAVESLITVLRGQSFCEKTVVDIGFLRFPDIENPFVRVYRIKLTAWSKCTRIGPRQVDTNGIAGEYNAYNFKPRRSVIESLSTTAKEKGVKFTEDLLDFDRATIYV